MSDARVLIETPLGDLVISARRAAPAGNLSLRSGVFEAQLPSGMSVAGCLAVVLHLAAGSESQVNFEATLHASESVQSGPETGEGLEAQSWRGDDHLVLVGTEDAELLRARAGAEIRLTNAAFTYSPSSFAVSFVHAGQTAIELHFLIAWNALPEPQDCSCWYAVDQPHARVLTALRANKSFDADTQLHCAAKRAGEHTPRGAMQLRAGQLQR